MHLVALNRLEEFKGLQIFNALGTNRHAQVVSEPGNCSEHLECDRIVLCPLQCICMNLDFVERQLIEGAQRNGSDTKIVETQTKTFLAKSSQRLQMGCLRIGKLLFGYLEGEIRTLETEALDDCFILIGQ